MKSFASPTQKTRVVVVARFEGRCCRCDTLIEIDQRIEKTPVGWMHENCPADPPDDDMGMMVDPDIGDR